MELDIQIVRTAIEPSLPPPPTVGMGAWVEFRGVVRGEEGGQSIAALEYEAYQPMAGQEMRRLLDDIGQRHPCLSARVIHRIGIVPVGEAAIYIGIAGRHRAESFAMLAEFMDRLKQDVPIWKFRTLASVEEIRRDTPCAPTPGRRRTDRPATAHSASEVRDLLGQLCLPFSAERIPLDQAAGRTLREPVLAPEDQPPFDRSSVDGYAVRLDDSGTRFNVVDEIRAGDWKSVNLQPGNAVRIATGGALPGEGLQVVMKEDVQVEDRTLTVLRRNGDRNIRFRGEDAQAGQELVCAGSVLQPGTLGLLASVGCVNPRVSRLPRALHLATGNEIIAPDRIPGRGQIRDSNSSLVRGFLAQWGMVPDQRRIAEDEEAVQSAIAGLDPGLDLLLISGGASVGEHDFTRSLLRQAGFTLHVSKTTARPGKPLIVAQRGGLLAFGLPGNPLAHFVCLNLYVGAALELWAGRQPAGFHTGGLQISLPADGNGRETFWPACWQVMAGGVMLTPLRWSSSGDLTALATANALLRIPSGTQHLEAGSEVEYLTC